LLRDLPLAPAIDDPWNAPADDFLLEEAVTFCALFAHDQLLGIEPEAYWRQIRALSLGWPADTGDHALRFLPGPDAGSPAIDDPRERSAR
jgi:hypothetical protein